MMDDKNIAYKGVWYMPLEKNNEVFNFNGELIITREGNVSLEFIVIMEEFDKILPYLKRIFNQYGNQKMIPYITGCAKNLTSKKDVFFTLIDLSIISLSHSKIGYVKLEAKKALLNYKIQNFEDLKFKTSMMKFEGIDSWLNQNGFKINPNYDSIKHITTVEYVQPDEIEIELSKTEILYFYFRAKSPLISNSKSVSIEESVYLNWESQNFKSLDELKELSDRLQNFFSLISKVPSVRLHHQLKKGVDVEETDNDHNALTLDYFHSDRASSFNDTIEEDDLLFTYSDFGDRSKDFLAAWLSVYDDYSVALDQYFDVRYNKNLHYTSRLITLTSVLEIFYYKKFDKDPILKIKLDDLISTKSKIFNQFPISKNSMIDRIVSVRKYFVHGKKNILNFNIEDTENNILRTFCFQLELVFKVCLLAEIGLSDEDIDNLISRRYWLWGSLDI